MPVGAACEPGSRVGPDRSCGYDGLLSSRSVPGRALGALLELPARRTSAWSRDSRRSRRTRPPSRFPASSTPTCARALETTGIHSLYVASGRRLGERRRGHAIVTTGTASGKSLCFNLPTLHVLRATARAALYLYPSKALAQDQARALSGCGHPASAMRSTTVTRPTRNGRRFARAQTSSSRTRTCSTSGSFPTTTAGATSWPIWPSSSSTRRTCTGAYSARTSQTCCAACAVWPGLTEPSRAS